MSEKHEQCAFCKALFFEDDDVVYCPICGAPHHRECYNSCGHCALEQFHGTDKEYNPHPENDRNADGEIPLDREGHICDRCGKMSSSDTIFCPYCGKPFSSEQPPIDNDGYRPLDMPFSVNIDLLGGIDKKTKIDGLEAGEVASFVRVNTRRYIPLFASMSEHKKKRSWNWSAFLFPAAWNAYRKNYLAAGVLMGVLISSFFLVSSLATATNAYLSQLSVDTRITLNVLSDAYNTVGPLHWLLFAAGLIMDLAARIISGFFGDYWYKKRVFEKIKAIKEDEEVENVEEELQYRGGVNQWLGLLALYPSALMIYQCFALVMQVLSWLMGGMMG